MINLTLQTQNPDAKEPTNILDIEQWSHRAVGRKQEEKTQMQQWDHSVTHQRHTLMMSEHFVQNVAGWSWEDCSTLPKWPLNIFWGFPWWYEHPALMPRWQHHLSSVYQPAFNSAPNMCGTDWEQLVLSSLFPWQLKILLYSKILSCYFYPPSFYFFFFVCVLIWYIFPLKKAMGLIN